MSSRSGRSWMASTNVLDLRRKRGAFAAASAVLGLISNENIYWAGTIMWLSGGMSYKRVSMARISTLRVSWKELVEQLNANRKPVRRLRTEMWTRRRTASTVSFDNCESPNSGRVRALASLRPGKCLEKSELWKTRCLAKLSDSEVFFKSAEGRR